MMVRTEKRNEPPKPSLVEVAANKRQLREGSRERERSFGMQP